uniref:Uncharacterized protein n=1 Tax=Mesocestoides corti TaxID=53468 RepID=A0A5K3FZF2_MESCO
MLWTSNRGSTQSGGWELFHVEIAFHQIQDIHHRVARQLLVGGSPPQSQVGGLRPAVGSTNLHGEIASVKKGGDCNNEIA